MSNLITETNKRVWREVNKVVDWHQLPTVAQLANLRAYRDELRDENLIGTREAGTDPQPTSAELAAAAAAAGCPHAAQAAAAGCPMYRTYDGSGTDPHDPAMGMAGSRFGRNVPAAAAQPENRVFEGPNPREVANALLNRDEFIPATTLNVLAAAWLQFQNHDWFGHGENSPTDFLDLELAPGDNWGAEIMRIRKTHPDRVAPGVGDGSKPLTWTNTETHWWDLSQLYGSTEERCRSLRTGEGGKLIMEDGRLPMETDKLLGGIDLTGFNDNYWLGLSLMHHLFAKEHNAICNMLASRHPTWDDEQLFLTARLINSAISAKIHTVEWTPGILGTRALNIGMNSNWYGLMPQWAQKALGNPRLGDELTGIVGGRFDHHTAPFQITEEFVSVYRMHPLIPDEYAIRDHRNGQLIDDAEFMQMQGKNTRDAVSEYGLANLYYSFGIANPGAVCLHNHPNALRNLTRVNGDRVDLATIDITRDRERGVLRYNDFREHLRMKRINKFENLTAHAEWNEQIREVYGGDIDAVDLQVGLLGETAPKGFGFSDTAFRIFILMASRRLKSDRFFTNDYRPEVYTPEGLEWIRRTSMSTLLLRHHPELAPALEGVGNAFAPWRKLDQR
jgi:hypothetical protein